jgi:hypothetical protein
VCPSGTGPFRTWAGLYAQRWGCGGGGRCPSFSGGGNVVNFVSNDTTDTISADIEILGGTQVTFQCPLGSAQLLATGVLSSFVARAYNLSFIGSTPGRGLYQAAIAGVTLGYDEMIVDTTNASTFWPVFDLTTSGGTPGVGDTWAFSQPSNGNAQTGTPVEVVISSGDSVSIYRPVKIVVNHLFAYVQSGGAGNQTANNLFIRDCDLSGSSNSITVNNGVSLDTDVIEGSFQSVPGSNGISIYHNVSASNGEVSVDNPTGGFGGQQNYVLAGVYGKQASAGGSGQNCLTTSTAWWDEDVYLGQTPGFVAGGVGNFIGSAYIDANASILVYPGADVGFQASALFHLGPQLWGPGDIGVLEGANVTYPSGAGQAVATFLNRGGTANGELFWSGHTTQSTFYYLLTGPFTLSPAQLDTTLGATVGCAYWPGGGSICN